MSEDFERLVQTLMVNDNAARSDAEAAFNDLKQSPDNLATYLVQAIRVSNDEVVRSMSCILLRYESFNAENDEKSMWRYLNPEVREMIKTELLLAMEEEPNAAVVKQVCDCIGEMAAYIHGGEEESWPELLPFLFRCTQNPSADARSSALFIFSRMAMYMTDALQEYFEVLRDVFQAALQDDNSRLRKEGLRACTNLLVNIADDRDRMFFQPLLSSMLECISFALNNRDEETAMSAIQLFIDVAEHKSRFLRKELEDVVNAMIMIAGADELDPATRHLALEFLTILAEKAPAMLRKLPQFAEAVFPACLKMMVDLDDDPDWNKIEDDDDVEIQNSDFAEQAIDRIACAMGGAAIMPVAFDIIPDLLVSEHWQYRHAGLMSVSAIAEGCKAVMEEVVGEVVSICRPTFTDPHPRVRYAACQAFGQMCIDFAPGFQNAFHEVIVPGLVGIMGDFDNPRCQAHAAAALLNFANNAHQKILAGYLEDVLLVLGNLLENGETKAQEQALSAIAAMAECAGENFEPFYNDFMPILKQILSAAGGDEYRVLRGKSMEAISMIGLAVGKEQFLNDAIEVMDYMMSINVQDLPPDDPSVPYLVLSWARIAQCIRQDFLGYLDTIMPPLLASAQIKPTYTINDADEHERFEQGWQSITVGDQRIGIKTSALEDKATACRMIVCYLRDLREGFAPYVDMVAKIMVPLLSFYFHDSVRTAAAESCAFCVISIVYSNKETGQPGDAYLQELLEYTLAGLMTVIHAEPDLEILCIQLEAVHDIVIAAGEDCLTQDQLREMGALLALLIQDIEKRNEKRIAHQNDPDFDEEWQRKLEEEIAFDQLVLREVATVINALFRTHKANFVPVFDEQAGLWRELLGPNRAPTDRQWALCVYDDLVEYAPSAIQSYMEHFFEHMFNYVNSEEPICRQAAAYGMGACARSMGPDFAEYVNDAIQVLTNAINDPRAHGDKDFWSCTDNAVSAVAKIIEAQADAIDRSVLVPQLLSFLPMLEDQEEGYFVYSCVVSWIEANDPHVLGENGANVPGLMAMLTSILGTGFVDDDLTNRVVNIIMTVFGQLGTDSAEARAIIGEMDEIDQGKIAQILEAMA